jgi:periplasmic divalent cation tolerance protein
MPAVSLVYVTVSNLEEAEKIAKAVVTERLAACANVLGTIGSVYVWQGHLEQGTEVALLLKTREAVVDALIARVTQLHSYECPAILALPVLGGHPEFLKWVCAQTASPS